MLPEPLTSTFYNLKSQGLTIEANNLIVPVGRWRLPYLLRDNRIDMTNDLWVLRDCSYDEKIGLVID